MSNIGKLFALKMLLLQKIATFFISGEIKKANFIRNKFLYFHIYSDIGKFLRPIGQVSV